MSMIIISCIFYYYGDFIKYLAPFYHKSDGGARWSWPQKQILNTRNRDRASIAASSSSRKIKKYYHVPNSSI